MSAFELSFPGCCRMADTLLVPNRTISCPQIFLRSHPFYLPLRFALLCGAYLHGSMQGEVEIVKLKNRFKNPTPSGFRDFNFALKLKVQTPSGDFFHHVCELQVRRNQLVVLLCFYCWRSSCILLHHHGCEMNLDIQHFRHRETHLMKIKYLFDIRQLSDTLVFLKPACSGKFPLQKNKMIS